MLGSRGDLIQFPRSVGYHQAELEGLSRLLAKVFYPL